jgi:hypothetical protein
VIKTFHSDPGGWTDQQLPYGTVILTAATGHTYVTEAHGGALCPASTQPSLAHRQTRSRGVSEPEMGVQTRVGVGGFVDRVVV